MDHLSLSLEQAHPSGIAVKTIYQGIHVSSPPHLLLSSRYRHRFQGPEQNQTLNDSGHKGKRVFETLEAQSKRYVSVNHGLELFKG